MSEQIAAVGMGRMGRGIAITFAFAGLPVSLIDLKTRSKDDYITLEASARKEISKTLDMLCGFGMLDSGELDQVLPLISYCNAAESPAALNSAQIIFEGVPETLEAKQSALQLICEHATTEAIIASTTSTMLSDELQSMVSHPHRFLNAHWLNPAYLVPLVELSPAKQTDPSVTQTIKTLLEKIGKVPVVCAASPGYIVPRIQALAMNEAARMVEEGVATAEDIDKATRYGFGFRFAVLGLLEFIDWGGGDILYHASRYMASSTGDDRHQSPQIIADNMQQGRIGLSTQKGFLDYEGMDVPAYQQEKLAAFVAMLRHIDQMPVRKQPDREIQTSESGHKPTEHQPSRSD